MSNIFLFTGLNQYLLNQQLKLRKEKFLDKYGEQGFFSFRADDLDKATIQNAVFGGGMFATKKLVIIYGLPKDSSPANKAPASKLNDLEDYLISHRDHISSETVLILVSYKPDKRTKSYKFLSKNTDLKEFKPYKGSQLTSFVQKYLGDIINAKHADLIVSLVGDDMYNLANECEKLKTYASYHKLTQLTPGHINDIVFTQAHINSFDILDNLFTNKQKTLKLIEQAQHQNQDIFQFLGMLYRGLKLVIQTIDLHEHGVKSSKEIAKKIKLHPFAVAKQHKHIVKLTENKKAIHNFFQQLLNLDISIKSGTYPSEGFWIEIKKLVYAL